MLKPLIWEFPRSQTEALSLFSPGTGVRPLRLTLHSQSFEGLNPAENAAIDLLREFASLEDLEILETDATFPQYIQIPEFDPNKDQLRVPYNKTEIEEVVFVHVAQLHEITAWLLNIPDRLDSQVMSFIPELILLRTHIQLQQDILVTGSHFLLDHADKPFLRSANVRTPIETIKIIGLLLRSRGNYVNQVMGKLRLGINPSEYYRVLTRHRLPHMWKYISACVHSENIRRDGTLGLGESVLTRSIRAIQARDAIGKQFYLPLKGSTIDEMLYHFDFLTLVLSGALDAQARVAHRAYHIQKPKEHFVNFRINPEKGTIFANSLRQAGAGKLVDCLKDPNHQGVIGMLFTLRNTIHGENVQSMTVKNNDQQADRSVLIIPDAIQPDFQNALIQMGPKEDWGVVKMHKYCIEPYTFSYKLVDECFRLIDQIAETTEVERLFPSGPNIPNLLDEPPDEHAYRKEIRERIDLLG